MAVQAGNLELDCHDCPPGMQKFRGCMEEVESTEFEFEGETLKRCPLKLVTQTSKLFLRFYQFMEKGFLPNPGGILDQPNRFVEAIAILNDSISNVQRERRRESEMRKQHATAGQKWR